MLTSSFGSAGSAGAGLAILGVLAGIGIALMIGALIISVLTIIATWKIFTKAGEAGWKSLIPIYNTYILFKIAGRSFWRYFFIALGMNIFRAIAENVSSSAVVLILSIVAFALAIWLLVETVKCCHGLSKNFGHGAGFTVGLIFLNTIFMLILGFGSSQYQGIQTNE